MYTEFGKKEKLNHVHWAYML